jgi:hypothetical protein
VFCTYLKTDNIICYTHHQLVGFNNRGGKCLERGAGGFLKSEYGSSLKKCGVDRRTRDTKCLPLVALLNITDPT